MLIYFFGVIATILQLIYIVKQDLENGHNFTVSHLFIAIIVSGLSWIGFTFTVIMYNDEMNKLVIFKGKPQKED